MGDFRFLRFFYVKRKRKEKDSYDSTEKYYRQA